MKYNLKSTRCKQFIPVILWVGMIVAIGIYFFVSSPINSDLSPSLAGALPAATVDESASDGESIFPDDWWICDARDAKSGIGAPNSSQRSRPMPDQFSSVVKAAVQTEQDDTLWRPATNLSESEKRAIGGNVHDNIENRAYITLNRQAIANLKVGDVIELPIPQQDRAYTGLITEVIEHDEHNISWTGHLESYGTDYSIIISQSETGTMATLDTPDGQYMLEANGENARLTSIHELTKHIDYSQSDVVDVGLGRE